MRAALPLLILAVNAAAAQAQSVLERTPNLHGGWTGTAGALHFNFVHRFNNSGAPERQVTNRPTFLLGWSAHDRLLVGAHYSTRSALHPRYPNEWEPFARAALLSQQAGRPADLALQLGWNAAARSFDGDVTLGRSVDRLRLLGSVRVLGRDVHDGETRVALGAGAALQVAQHVAVSADVGRRAGVSGAAVWGAGLQLRLPASPHTLSVHVTNSDATTLHSASRAADHPRWGFELTVPVTVARYFRRAAAPAPQPPGRIAGDTIALRIRIHNLAYAPDTVRVPAGSVVEWRNDDPLPHTVTLQDGSWDSGAIQPGATWRHRLDRPGRYDITCTPHPFMRALLIVER
jgi:plastocyanin